MPYDLKANCLRSKNILPYNENKIYFMLQKSSFLQPSDQKWSDICDKAVYFNWTNSFYTQRTIVAFFLFSLPLIHNLKVHFVKKAILKGIWRVSTEMLMLVFGLKKKRKEKKKHKPLDYQHWAPDSTQVHPVRS